jgi:hypothetical protein
MGQAVLRDRIAKSAHHMILTEDISKSLRTIFSGEDLITHASPISDSPPVSHWIFCHFIRVEHQNPRPLESVGKRGPERKHTPKLGVSENASDRLR